MTTALVAFLVAFLVGTTVTSVVTWLAPIVGAVNEPQGSPGAHTWPISSLGGIGVFCGFLAPVLALMFALRELLLGQALWAASGPFPMVLAGAVAALASGLCDDVHGIHPRLRLLLQALAACVAMAGGVLISRLSLPMVGGIDLGIWAVPLTLLWFMSWMNAITLIDGLDGLAGGVSLIACFAMMAAGHLVGHAVCVLLLACLAGGIFGFLVHNFHPARIFLGDSGGNIIGFLIAALTTMTSQKSSAAIALLMPVLALGLPIMDASLAAVHRWSYWLPVSIALRQRIYRLVFGQPSGQRRAVLIACGASLVLCAVALLGMSKRRELLLIVYGGLGILVFVCIRVLGAVQLADLGHRFSRDCHRRETASLARVEFDDLLRRLPDLHDVTSVWVACERTFELMGIDSARLVMQFGNHQARPGREWAWFSTSCPRDLLDRPNVWQVSLQLDLPGHRPAQLRLAAGVAGDRLVILHQLDLLWRLRDALASHLLRVYNPAE